MSEKDTKQLAIVRKRELVNISPLFDVEQMSKTIMNGVQMYLDQKPMIEAMLKQQAPFMADMAKQISDSAKIYHSIFANLEMPKYLEEVQKQQEKLRETMADITKLSIVPLTDLNMGEITLSPFKQKEIKEKIEEEIFEEVIEKVEERSADIMPLELKMPIVILPYNAKWEEIKIVFKNRDDVKIYHKEKLFVDMNCEKLGFARNNTADKVPNKPWELLRAIAVISDQKMKGVKPTVLLLKNTLEIKNDDALHRVKLRLDRQLERIFGIKDPFLSYKEFKYYKPKFELISEPGIRDIRELWPSGRGLPKKLL